MNHCLPESILARVRVVGADQMKSGLAGRDRDSFCENCARPARLAAENWVRDWWSIGDLVSY